MEMSPVISATGEPTFSAGGKHAFKVHEHRGWVCSLEWVRRDRRFIPVMVIWPAVSPIARQAVGNGMWVIARTAITDFLNFTKDDKTIGSMSEYGYSQVKEALPIVGKDPNDKQAFLSLCDVVLRFADDLTTMPTAPKRVRQDLQGMKMWELTSTHKASGKVIAEAAI